MARVKMRRTRLLLTPLGRRIRSKRLDRNMVTRYRRILHGVCIGISGQIENGSSTLSFGRAMTTLKRTQMEVKHWRIKDEEELRVMESL